MFWIDVEVLIKDCRLSSDFAQAAISISVESKFAQLKAGAGGACAKTSTPPAVQANKKMEIPSLVRIFTLRLAVRQFPRQVRLILPIFSLSRNHSIVLELDHFQALAQYFNTSSRIVALPGNNLPPVASAGLAMEQAQHMAGYF
jgi:hypothetical protein